MSGTSQLHENIAELRNILGVARKLIDTHFVKLPDIILLSCLADLLTEGFFASAAAMAERDALRLAIVIAERNAFQFAGFAGLPSAMDPTDCAHIKDVEAHRVLKALLEAFAAMARLVVITKA